MRIKKVNGKKIWSFVLAMAMVIGILPQITMPVQAAGGEVYAVLRSDNKVYETNSDNTKTDGAVIADKYTITNLFVADGVTEIGSSAFQKCTVLKSITIPASVTSIRDAAFKDCIALTSVSIPKVTTIEFDAFNGCITLANLTVGATPPKVGEASFYLCPLDRTLTIVGGTAAVIALYDSYYYSTIDGLWIGWTLPAPIVSYDLWVGGVLVTSANANNITGDGIEGKVTYDAVENILKLTNATIKGYHNDVYNRAGIYKEGALKIVLVGENTVDISSTSVTGNSAGIWIDSGKLELSGKGSDSLTVKSGTSDGSSGAIFAIGNSMIKITDCTVNAIAGTSTESVAGNVNSALWGPQIVIQGATVTAVGGTTPGNNTYSEGIRGAKLTITDSTVTATGGPATGMNSGSCGIFGALTITNSTVTAIGGNTSGWSGGILNENGAMTITNSTVTAIGNSCALAPAYTTGSAIASTDVNGKNPVPGSYDSTKNGSYKWFQSVSGGTPPPVTQTHTVSFSGGTDATGTAPTQAATAEKGTFKLPTNTFTKTGYTFVGWNDGTKTYQPNESYTMPAKAVTFTAQWTKDGTPPATKTYTVTYNANGGTGTILPQTTDVGTTTTLTTNTFTRTGYTFKEWNTKADGKGTSYTNSLPTQPAGTTVTLYAQWTEDTYNVTGDVVDADDKKIEGADVKLMKGNKQIGVTVKTGSDGKFTIANVPNGTYNLVVSKGDITVTTIIVISSADKATGTIKLPSGKTNSIVDVKPNTPQIVVGGLDKQFSKTATDNEKGVTQEDKDVITALGSVEIKLTAEEKDNTAPNASDISATASSNGKKVGQFIDLSVLKTVTPNAGVATATPLKELQDLVEIFIPLDTALQGKSEYVIYRYHGTGVDTITTVANADGEMIALVDNNTTIKLTVKKFSTYAIAYKNTPTGGGGSTGGGSTGGTTGGEPEKPEIVKPVPPVEKPIPPVVKPKPPIVKPLPPKKPAKNPQTGDNTPLEFPITLGTLGLALMALGLYLKRKQQSAE